MRCIAVISRKGGSGKTTLAVNLALMGRLMGLSTVLVDCDPQRAATLVLKARELAGPDVMSVPAGAVYPATVEARRNGRRLMVIDTPVSPEGDIVQVAKAAHLSLIVCRPTVLDINAAVQSADMLRQLGKAGAIVLTQTPKRDFEDPAVRRSLKALRLAGMPIIGTLGVDPLYQQSLDQGRSVAELEAEPGLVSGEMEDLWCAIEHQLARTREPVANPEPIRKFDPARRLPTPSAAVWSMARSI